MGTIFPSDLPKSFWFGNVNSSPSHRMYCCVLTKQRASPKYWSLQVMCISALSSCIAIFFHLAFALVLFRLQYTTFEDCCTQKWIPGCEPTALPCAGSSSRASFLTAPWDNAYDWGPELCMTDVFRSAVICTLCYNGGFLSFGYWQHHMWFNLMLIKNTNKTSPSNYEDL